MKTLVLDFAHTHAGVDYLPGSTFRVGKGLEDLLVPAMPEESAEWLISLGRAHYVEPTPEVPKTKKGGKP